MHTMRYALLYICEFVRIYTLSFLSPEAEGEWIDQLQTYITSLTVTSVT